MKYSIVLAAAAAALASAQLSAFPTCGVTCLTSNIQGSGCDLTDMKCACQNEALVKKVGDCIDSTCDDDDKEKSAAAAKELCAAFGVVIGPSESGSAPVPSATEDTGNKEGVYSTPASTGVMPSSTSGSNGTYSPPVSTQPAGSGAPSRASAAFGLAGLGLLAAAFVL